MKTVALGEVATIDRRGVDPGSLPPQTAYLGLEHIERGGRIIGRGTVGEAELASTKFHFSERHVLFGKLRPNLGKVSRPDFDGVCSTDILPIRPGNNLDKDYLAHYLSQPSMVRFAASRTSGANLPRLSPAVLSQFPIPLPPLPEQRRIAAILDHADALRAKRRQVLAQLDSLTQSIFHDMFGDLKTNPHGYDLATVGDVSERVTDGEHKTPRRSASGFPLLSARNIRDGWIDFENTDFIDADEYAGLSRRIEPREGDLLISCSGTIGRVAQVRGRSRFAMVRSAALVRPGQAVDPTFLERTLASPALRSIMVSQANSSAQANLFQNQIRRLPVVVPPLGLQREFAGRACRVAALRATAASAFAADGELFASLQSRAFDGRL